MSGCHPPEKPLDWIKPECTCKCHVSQNQCCDKCTYPPNFIDALKYHTAIQDHSDLDTFKEVFGLNPPSKAEKSKILTDALKRLSAVELTIKELVDKIADIANFYYREKKAPHKCPNCDGQGHKYHAMIHKIECHSCQGAGILWG